MENFQDTGVWIRIRSLKNAWIRIRIRFVLSWEVVSGSGLSWEVGSGQYQTGSATLPIQQRKFHVMEDQNIPQYINEMSCKNNVSVQSISRIHILLVSKMKEWKSWIRKNTGCLEKCVFVHKLSKFCDLSPSPALGCHWLYTKWPANWSDIDCTLRPE